MNDLERLKKKSIKQLKDELWKEFSLYNKQKRAHKGSLQCYTCEKELTIGSKDCHLGHWLPKKVFPFHYWNENNVRPQCYRCNIWAEGNSEAFRRKLQRELGSKIIDQMFNTRSNIRKYNKQDYINMIIKYKELNNECT